MIYKYLICTQKTLSSYSLCLLHVIKKLIERRVLDHKLCTLLSVLDNELEFKYGNLKMLK